MTPARARHVFVYGTLRRGEQRDINRLHPPPRWLGVASIPGEIYDLGTYPGLKSGGEQLVVGEVYAIEPRLEQLLDEIEEVGSGPDTEYQKREITVRLDAVSGLARSVPPAITCLVYEATPAALRGKAPIAGGDWVLYRRGMERQR